MHDYYAVPNQYNGGKTLHGYWMEDSHGQIGVDVEVFGPYTMPGKLVRVRHRRRRLQRRRRNQANSPAGRDTLHQEHPHRRRHAWRADDRLRRRACCGFDNGFYVTAGHDESSTWQEFGEMMFQTRDDSSGRVRAAAESRRERAV